VLVVPQAGRLRVLLDIEEAEAAKKAAVAAEKARAEEEAKAADAERVANTLSPYQRMLQKQAAAKAKAEAEAAEKARLAQVTYSSDESSEEEEEYLDSDDEAAKEKELEREAKERAVMDEEDKWSKLRDAIWWDCTGGDAVVDQVVGVSTDGGCD
jgi:translation initiation factor 4G